MCFSVKVWRTDPGCSVKIYCICFLNDRLLPGHQYCPSNTSSAINNVKGPAFRCSGCCELPRRLPILHRTFDSGHFSTYVFFSAFLWGWSKKGYPFLPNTLVYSFSEYWTLYTKAWAWRRHAAYAWGPLSPAGKETKQSKGNKTLQLGSGDQLMIHVNKTRVRTKTSIRLFLSAKRHFGR